MGEKESKWLEHLKAAESSSLKLSAYAANHQIDVRPRVRHQMAQVVDSYRATRVRQFTPLSEVRPQ